MQANFRQLKQKAEELIELSAQNIERSVASVCHDRSYQLLKHQQDVYDLIFRQILANDVTIDILKQFNPNKFRRLK